MVSGQKILVVDDESVIRDLLSDILSDEGYAVHTAPSGGRALDLLRDDDEFILLFTDIMMPEMDGIELIRKARGVRPEIIPIVMTGYATLESARAAVKEGAYDYVLKPFSLSEVKLAVSNAFERYDLAHENARLREISELFNISEAIATFRDEGQLLDFVLKAALERVNASRGSVLLTSPDGEELQVAASIGLPEEAEHAAMQMGSGISGWVAEHNKPLFVQDIHDAPQLDGISCQLVDKSFISVPLERKICLDERGRAARHSDPGVVAVLNVTSKQGSSIFNESDLKMLSIIAKHASAALENVRLIKDIEDSHLSTLNSMALLIEAKDKYTHGHSTRVRNYAVMAAMKLGLGPDDVETIRLGSTLHDIGKIGVADAVLNKVEKLTDDEWRSIKMHPVIGYDVLENVRFLSKEHLALVRSHHERIDGRGYPDGLKGDELSPLVRIIAVADAYDAMSSSRAYRAGLTPQQIVEELKRCSGAQFDPEVAALFIDLIENGEIEHFAKHEPRREFAVSAV